MAGNIDLNFATPQTGLRQAKAGRVRALGVTSATRLPAAPEIPPIAEQGVPGYEVINWQSLIGPKAMPRPIVDRLNAELHRALALPDIQAKLKEGGNIATPTTPEGMRQQMADEIANWRQVIEANNIKVN